MERNAIFLDVDGTLVDAMRNEYIPPSAIAAVRETRERGNLVFLCTGRSKAEIYPQIYDIGIDGVIGAAGGFIELGEEEIFHRTIETEAAHRIIRHLDEKGIDYYLECNDGLYASKNLVPHLELVLYGDVLHDPEARKRKEAGSYFIDALKPVADCSLTDINKISFLETNGSRYSDVAEFFGEDFYMVRCTVPDFGEESGEISVKGINKSTAIHFLTDYLNREKPGTFTGKTYAVGDGGNDKEMFAAVDVAIAMGNAKEELKQLADYVTTDIREDGIWNAFKHFGLIE